LSSEKLNKLLSGSVYDLIIRVANKLIQFDEFFYRESMYISRDMYIGQNFDSWGGGGITHQGSKKDIANFVAQAIQNNVRQLTISFNWEGFRKAGLHDFSISVQMQFVFEKRKYLISCGNIKFSRQLMYQQRLSDDEAKQFVSQIANFCLADIERNRKISNAG
jgi:hypothetical protein